MARDGSVVTGKFLKTLDALGSTQSRVHAMVGLYSRLFSPRCAADIGDERLNALPI
jgi:hypothetical protein